MHMRWGFQESWQHGLGNGIWVIVYLLQRMYRGRLTRLSFVNIHYNNLNINSSLISMFSRDCGAAPQ